jgi:HEPN superfamily Apea-like protein
VLEGWLAVDHERRDARVQFSDGFSNGNQYDVGRLVSSANMFDILPANAVPLHVDLPEDLRTARSETRQIFKTLPKSFERDSVLSALGRLGTATLKHKARHRGQIVLAEAGERFPDLLLVLEEAVNCRNHYVHGSPARIDYRNHFFETVSFFTETLEFVFAASDLIEAGWGIGPWLKKGTSMSHPFGTYRVSYNDGVRALKALLDAAANEAPGS